MTVLHLHFPKRQQMLPPPQPSVKQNDPVARFITNNERDESEFREYSLWGRGPIDGRSIAEDGGTYKGITYHGDFSDAVSLDVLYRTTEEEIPLPASSLPLYQYCSSGSCISYSTHSNNTIEPQKFNPAQFRADLHGDSADQQISVGIDKYDDAG